MDSGNLVAAGGLDGQKSWNYFRDDWSNITIDPKSAAIMVLLQRFRSFTDYITEVGVSNMSTHDQHGKKEAKPVFPYKLRFAPSKDLQWSDDYTVDLIE